LLPRSTEIQPHVAPIRPPEPLQERGSTEAGAREVPGQRQRVLAARGTSQRVLVHASHGMDAGLGRCAFQGGEARLSCTAHTLMLAILGAGRALHTRGCLHGLLIASFNTGRDPPVVAASEFGNVCWFKKAVGSNTARTRGLDNGLSVAARQNYYDRRGLAFRQAKW